MTGTEPAHPADALRDSLFRRDLAMTRHRATVCRQLGLDDTELRALMHLLRHGPMTASRLSVLLDLSSGGVTHLVQRLDRAGHLVRRPHPTDRRSRLVALAPAMRAELPALLDPAPAGFDTAAAALLPDELGAVAGFLAGLAARAEAATRPPDGPGDAAPPPTVERIVPSRWM